MKAETQLAKPVYIFLVALVCCFLWGSATPAIKSGYEVFLIASSDTVSIIFFAGVRFFLAGVLVILFQSIGQKRLVLPEKGSAGAICSLALAQTILQYFCFYIGLAHTSGVAGTILSGTGGFFSIIIAALVFRTEKFTPVKAVACVLALLGVIVMNVNFSGGDSFSFTFLGEGMVLLSQISYATSSSLVKRYSSRFSVATLSGYQFMLGGAVMAIVGFALGGRMATDAGFTGVALMIYLAMISAVAYTLWGILMKYNPVSKVSIYNFLTPLFGVLLSAIVLGEIEQALSLNKLLALAFVVAGIVLVNKKPSASKA